MANQEFHTFREDMKKEEKLLTASMEDYLEMIYRLSLNTGFTRINELSDALHVHPPSATKMVQRLGELNLLRYERYGVILLEEEGRELGKSLLKRHSIMETFLELMNVSEENILKETEKMEHTLSPETVSCFEAYIAFMKENPDIYHQFKTYQATMTKVSSV